MLGWMLRRGENAPDLGDEDTTQIDQPDTPAPVFAARALKSALFGTPAKTYNDHRVTRKKMLTQKPAKETRTTSMGSKAAPPPPKVTRLSETPTKPHGILLTPGTAASKRKRVSFGRGVLNGFSTDLDRVCELDETAGKDAAASSESRPTAATKANMTSEDEWEEEEEEEEEEDEGSAHDVTTDLNEPHSQSGRYWKEEFLKYHQEARAEMEKLLKYKQLAKSYAQQKDAEAIQLAGRLRDEQKRVAEMEKRIADNASQIRQHRQTSGEDPTELLRKLDKQSALASQYRQRVQELESQMQELQEQREHATGSETPRRRFISTPSTSVTQRALTETRRELRQARSQLKEMASLRDEVFDLKMKLKKTELKLAVNEKEEARAVNGPRAQELRILLKAAKEESRQKDTQIRQLQSDCETLRKNHDDHDAETKAVLSRAHNKIAELKKEIKALKSLGSNQGQSNDRHSHASDDGVVKRSITDKQIRKTSQEYGRHILDDETLDLGKHGAAPPRSLRQQFKDDAGIAAVHAQIGREPAQRRTQDTPTRQSFVPQSPWARDDLQEDSKKAAENAQNDTALQRPHLVGNRSRGGRKSNVDVKGSGDVLSDMFARLAGPEANGPSTRNASVGTLPPERRAAALARIEKRMAEKKLLRSREANYERDNKENVQP